MKIGTPSWWSPPQPPAGSKVPRPATTAPVAMNSATTRPLTPGTRPDNALRSPSAPIGTQSCRRCPPSPRPFPGPALGPATNPSSDMDMYRTVADTTSPFSHLQFYGDRGRPRNSPLGPTTAPLDGPARKPAGAGRDR